MSCGNAVISSVIHRTPSLLFTGGFFVRENKYTIYVALNILIMYLVVVMKHKHRTASILAAIEYLIRKQKLKPEEVQKLIIKTIQDETDNQRNL